MNGDERTPGQQGSGEQSPQERSQQTDQTQTEQRTSQDGSMSTGQASYGNSGDTGSDTASQNSTTLGQESDIGQSGGTEQGRETRLFTGSDDDMGSSAGTGRTGIDGSADNPGQPDAGLGGSTGRSGIEGSMDDNGEAIGQNADAQSFADQGQGAMNEDLMGSSSSSGTTDIETERSQGRESDIEGSSL